MTVPRWVRAGLGFMAHSDTAPWVAAPRRSFGSAGQLTTRGVERHRGYAPGDPGAERDESRQHAVDDVERAQQRVRLEALHGGGGQLAAHRRHVQQRKCEATE